MDRDAYHGPRFAARVESHSRGWEHKMYSGVTTEEQIDRNAIMEEFVASWHLIPQTAEPVHDAAQLPPRLELRANVLRKGYFWRAWEDAGRLRFVVMNLTGSDADEHGGCPAMEAYFFDESARLVSAGSWSRVQPGRWQLTDRFEPSVAKWRYARLRPLLRSNLGQRRVHKGR